MCMCSEGRQVIGEAEKLVGISLIGLALQATHKLQFFLEGNHAKDEAVGLQALWVSLGLLCIHRGRLAH